MVTTVQCNTIHWNTIKYTKIQCNTIQYFFPCIYCFRIRYWGTGQDRKEQTPLQLHIFSLGSDPNSLTWFCNTWTLFLLPRHKASSIFHWGLFPCTNISSGCSLPPHCSAKHIKRECWESPDIVHCSIIHVHLSAKLSFGLFFSSCPTFCPGTFPLPGVVHVKGGLLHITYLIINFCAKLGSYS